MYFKTKSNYTHKNKNMYKRYRSYLSSNSIFKYKLMINFIQGSISLVLLILLQISPN